MLSSHYTTKSPRIQRIVKKRNDLKSFYASVECVERDLDPLTTNLVVADNSRTDKTICLAVSPGLKSYGLERARQEEDLRLEKERALQIATLRIKDKFGKNAILKGTDFLDGAMTRQRNQWIGGHRA